MNASRFANTFYTALLVISLVLSLVGNKSYGQAQVRDTASYPYRFFNFSLGQLVAADGRVYNLYLPYDGLGYTKVVPYFSQQPLRHKDRLQKFMSVRYIRSITVRDSYFEIITKAGQPTNRLAVRLLDGPVQLFMWMRTEKGNYSWYLRHGPDSLEEVRLATFREQIVPLLSQQPALADSVQRNLKGYRYQDLFLVLDRYNAGLIRQNKGGSKPLGK